MSTLFANGPGEHSAGSFKEAFQTFLAINVDPDQSALHWSKTRLNYILCISHFDCRLNENKILLFCNNNKNNISILFSSFVNVDFQIHTHTF